MNISIVEYEGDQLEIDFDLDRPQLGERKKVGEIV